MQLEQLPYGGIVPKLASRPCRPAQARLPALPLGHGGEIELDSERRHLPLHPPVALARREDRAGTHDFAAIDLRVHPLNGDAGGRLTLIHLPECRLLSAE